MDGGGGRLAWGRFGVAELIPFSDLNLGRRKGDARGSESFQPCDDLVGTVSPVTMEVTMAVEGEGGGGGGIRSHQSPTVLLQPHTLSPVLPRVVLNLLLLLLLQETSH
jgi:hypothetical protein